MVAFMTAIDAHEVAALVENAGMPVDIDGDHINVGISPVDDGWLLTAGPIVDGCFRRDTMLIYTDPEEQPVEAEQAQAWDVKFVADRLVWQAREMLNNPVE